MKNLNPLYLVEGEFFKSIKNLGNAGRAYTKQRWTGRSKELFKLSKKNWTPDQIRNRASAYLDADILNGSISRAEKAKYLQDLENYLAAKNTWNSAKSDLYSQAKGLFKTKDQVNPSQVVNPSKDPGLTVPLGAAALGIYGAKTGLDVLANETSVKK